jgi:choline dehydrogenase
MASKQISAEEFAAKHYDFIIIGGGTAGLVLAARLTENPSVSVGVIEAGENRLNDPMIQIPGLHTKLYEKPEYDWIFKTVPQVSPVIGIKRKG